MFNVEAAWLSGLRRSIWNLEVSGWNLLPFHCLDLLSVKPASCRNSLQFMFCLQYFFRILSVPDQRKGDNYIWHKFYLYFEYRQAVDRDGSCSSPMETSDRPDLSLLKPLWSLYTSMLEKEGGEKVTSLLMLNGLRSLALGRERSQPTIDSRRTADRSLPKSQVSSFWLIFHVVFKTVSDCSGFEQLGFSLSSPLFLVK